MDLNYIEIPETKQKYFIKGENPSLLIVSGTHGDEYEVVPLVEEMVMKYADKLPDFLYVPEVSPSAVALRTRKNKDGLDVNRNFFEETLSQEIKEMMELWKKFKFDLFITFHEDPELKEFYLYDGAREEDNERLKLKEDPALKLLKKDITEAGIGLYNGVDDPNDPNLGYESKDGYINTTIFTKNVSGAEDWLLITGTAKHIINPEIPGKIPLEKKREIVEAIFKRLLLNETD